MNTQTCNPMCMCAEPSPEPKHLEQSGENVSLSDQTLPQYLRVHRPTLPSQVTSDSTLWCGRSCRMIWRVYVSGRRMTGNSLFGIRLLDETTSPCQHTTLRWAFFTWRTECTRFGGSYQATFHLISLVVMMVTCLQTHLYPGADPGAGGWPGGRAEVIYSTKWSNWWEDSSGAFPGSHRNYRASIRTPVCPEHHEEDKQPAGHHCKVNYITHNPLSRRWPGHH